MLALLGLAMVVVFTLLIMTKRLSPIVALTLVPIAFALIGGFGGTTGKMMLDGLKMVNDTLGHEQGDRMLAVAAQILSGAFRAGGDLSWTLPSW